MITILLLAILLIRPVFAQDISVSDINWNPEQGLLTYNLSQESPVKIRVGLYAGPVYRTILNLENRLKGKNQEHWDAKDEEGKIDFSKYAKLHFCVDSPVKPQPDSLLKVKFIKGINGPITIDVQDNLRELFNKYGAELRVYLDNRLLKIERLKSLPATFNLKIDDIAGGRHLLVINLWDTLNFSSVAYKSSEVIIPPQKSQTLKGKIVFSQRDKDGFWQLFTSELDGKNVRAVTSSPIDKRYPAWSSDGSQLAYVTNQGELWVMDSNGSNNHKVPLPLNSSEPHFSPDAKKIIFTALEDVYHGSTKIWQVDLDTLKLTKLVNRPWLQYNARYSPDMQEVIFTDGPELFGQEIRKLNLKTGDITQITDNGPYAYDMQASFLRSGQEIVYATNEDGDYEIYKMDKFGRNKINLTQSPNSYDIMPNVSKDDKAVYFLSDRSGKLAIWKINLDGSEPKQLTQNETDIASFSIYTD